jgi:DNA-binding response OmpR family regulator
MARIMIVDDESDLAELYRMALSAGGHRIEGIFADPGVPLRSDRASLSPEVIILDERLGWKSGIAHLARFRARFPKARVLLASADPEALDAATLQGVDAVKKKPFPLGDLLEEIQRLTRGA